MLMLEYYLIECKIKYIFHIFDVSNMFQLKNNHIIFKTECKLTNFIQIIIWNIVQ